MDTTVKTIGGVVIGIALTGLLLYSAGKSTNPTIKALALKITAGYGAA